jgi:hypothetical protein
MHIFIPMSYRYAQVLSVLFRMTFSLSGEGRHWSRDGGRACPPQRSEGGGREVGMRDKGQFARENPAMIQQTSLPAEKACSWEEKGTGRQGEK